MGSSGLLLGGGEIGRARPDPYLMSLPLAMSRPPPVDAERDSITDFNSDSNAAVLLLVTFCESIKISDEEI